MKIVEVTIKPVAAVTDSPLRTRYGDIARHDDPAPQHPAVEPAAKVKTNKSKSSEFADEFARVYNKNFKNRS